MQINRRTIMQRFKTARIRQTATIFGAILLLAVCVASAFAAGQADLTQLSLEDLMNITITSVSKKAQPLSDAPAAVFVITADDIRRSGATSIADALRMVPGLQVAKLDANKWAITSRGFNGRFANKLLVLMDGRSIYTPWFSGVFWETVDTMLEDIERIEVIRGPGASLWGANAVNGVINIITRKAQETQGGLLAGTIGTEERGIGALRYGTRIGKDTALRAFAKYISRDAAVDATGHNTADDWHIYAKENPKQGFQQRNRLFFERIKRIRNCTYVDSTVSTCELMTHCQFVASITGTACWEAVSGGKPALVFGYAWFKKLPGVTIYDETTTLDDIMSKQFTHEELEAAFSAVISKAAPGIVDSHYIQIYDDFDLESNNRLLTDFLRKVL